MALSRNFKHTIQNANHYTTVENGKTSNETGFHESLKTKQSKRKQSKAFTNATIRLQDKPKGPPRGKGSQTTITAVSRNFEHQNSKCESLYHSGKWKNFKQNGFSRKFENETIKSIYQLNYPFAGNGKKRGRFEPDQNFSGTWVGESECEIKILTRNHLEECFTGTTKISLFGDSRTRQIYHSLNSYLREDLEKSHLSEFGDNKMGHDNQHRSIIPGMLELSFTWSNAFKANHFLLRQNFTSVLDLEIKNSKFLDSDENRRGV